MIQLTFTINDRNGYVSIVIGSNIESPTALEIDVLKRELSHGMSRHSDEFQKVGQKIHERLSKPHP